MSVAERLLIIAELADGKPIALVHEMLGLARARAEVAGAEVHACLLASDGNAARELIAHGAHVVHVVAGSAFEPYRADAWLPDVASLAVKLGVRAVLLGHTALGADLAPRLAFRVQAGIATACQHVAWDAHRLLVTRACYGGKAEEVVAITTPMAVFTVKAKCFAPWTPSQRPCGEAINVPSVLDPASIRTRVRTSRRDAADGADLESASIVVAGGGGMKGKEGFALLDRLAAALGGAVGASRVACDLGWCPPSRQVGLSGKTVAPELYLAIGISGAGQHMAGCANAKTIVAINTDRDAPIFRHARFGVVADCHQVVPALVAQIEARGK